MLGIWRNKIMEIHNFCIEKIGKCHRVMKKTEDGCKEREIPQIPLADHIDNKIWLETIDQWSSGGRHWHFNGSFGHYLLSYSSLGAQTGEGQWVADVACGLWPGLFTNVNVNVTLGVVVVEPHDLAPLSARPVTSMSTLFL